MISNRRTLKCVFTAIIFYIKIEICIIIHCMSVNMRKNYSEKHEIQQQQITLDTAETEVGKSEVFPRRKIYVHEIDMDDNDSNQVLNKNLEVRCDEIKQQQYPKRRQFENMPSAQKVRNYLHSKIPVMSSSTSASSLPSETVSFKTNTLINNGLKKDDNTSIINNNKYNNQTNSKLIRQKYPLKHVEFSQSQNKKKVRTTAAASLKKHLAQHISHHNKQQLQIQYNQQVQSYQRNSLCNTTIDLNHFQRRQLFACDELRKDATPENIVSDLQRQEGNTCCTQDTDSAFFHYSANSISIKFLHQVGDERINKSIGSAANTGIVCSNVQSEILNTSLNTTLTKKNKNPSNNNNKNRQRETVNIHTKHLLDSSHRNIDRSIPVATNNFKYANSPTERASRYEEFESIESSKSLERVRSFQKNYTRNISNGGGYATSFAANSSLRLVKSNKPYSQPQNSEVDFIADPNRKRFSYCSSCSSSNSCNCDITGENSNSLYEGFGVGIIVSNSYTEDCVTGSGGTVSLESAPTGQLSGSSSFGALIKDTPHRFQLHGIESSEKFYGDREEDHDRISNFSDNCSDFETSSLTEELSQAAPSNKILSNNFKNYSKFHGKLNKKLQKQRFSQIIRDDESFNDNLETQIYKVQHYNGDQTLYTKNSVHHNIFFGDRKNSLNFNMKNFDAGNKINSQTDIVKSYINRSDGMEEQNDIRDVDQNATTTGIPHIPETVNGTTICGPTPGAGTNQQKTTGTTQKRPQRRGGKQQPDRPERALFCLTLKNPVRAFCVRIVDSKHPF